MSFCSISSQILLFHHPYSPFKVLPPGHPKIGALKTIELPLHLEMLLGNFLIEVSLSSGMYDICNILSKKLL